MRRTNLRFQENLIRSSAGYSKSAEEFVGQQFDYIITVCDYTKETCPVFPGKATRIHQSFEDPPPETSGDYESRLMIFRRVRNEIREWMKQFAASPPSVNAAWS